VSNIPTLVSQLEKSLIGKNLFFFFISFFYFFSLIFSFLFLFFITKKTIAGVREWGISQSTLEEVFLKLIREVNPTNGKAAPKKQ